MGVLSRGSGFSYRAPTREDWREEPKIQTLSVDEFEARLLCFAEITDSDARALFEAMDPKRSGFVSWEQFASAVDHAHAYLQVEGLHATILRATGSKSLDVGAARIFDQAGCSGRWQDMPFT